jgi:hypothetical protein
MDAEEKKFLVEALKATEAEKKKACSKECRFDKRKEKKEMTNCFLCNLYNLWMEKKKYNNACG